MLRLIKLWLKAPIEERDGDGKRRMSGGKSNARGTPQGGVASPLLANIYMNRFLKHWRLTARGKAFRAHSDDLVLAAFGQSLLNFSSSQSFAPLVRDTNEKVSIRLHDLQITSSHQCTIDARASF